MQKKNNILITISLIIMQCQNVSSIDWKFPFLIALLAPQTKSECTIYNRSNQSIIIQDSSDNLLWPKINKFQMPIQSKISIDPCFHLDILPNEKTTYIKELDYKDQPHGWSSAYTITEKSCKTNCTQIKQTLYIKPGVPEEFTSSLKNLSDKELGYVLTELIKHLETINKKSIHKNKTILKKTA